MNLDIKANQKKVVTLSKAKLSTKVNWKKANTAIPPKNAFLWPRDVEYFPEKILPKAEPA